MAIPILNGRRHRGVVGGRTAREPRPVWAWVKSCLSAVLLFVAVAIVCSPTDLGAAPAAGVPVGASPAETHQATAAIAAPDSAGAHAATAELLLRFATAPDADRKDSLQALARTGDQRLE